METKESIVDRAGPEEICIFDPKHEGPKTCCSDRETTCTSGVVAASPASALKDANTRNARMMSDVDVQSSLVLGSPMPFAESPMHSFVIATGPGDADGTVTFGSVAAVKKSLDLGCALASASASSNHEVPARHEDAGTPAKATTTALMPA